MAGNDYRDRVAIVGHAYGAKGVGLVDGAGNVGIGTSFAIGNREQRLPAGELEVGAAEIERESELATLAGKVFVQLLRVGAQEVRSFLELELCPFGLPHRLAAEIAGIGTDRLLAGRAGVKFESHQPGTGRGQEKQAYRRRNRLRMKHFHRIPRKRWGRFSGLPDHNIMIGNNSWRGFGLYKS